MKYINLFLLAGMLVCFAFWIGNWSENASLRKRMERTEGIIRNMKAEHELALAAASEAMRAREEIHEYQRQRICEAEAAMGNHPDYCSQPLPDDIARLFQKSGAGPGGGVQSAGGASGGY